MGKKKKQSTMAPDNISAAISKASGRFTKLESRIAAYFVGRPEALVLETSAAVAEKLEVSPMTITRFFKKLGFDSSATARAMSKEQIFGTSTGRLGHRFQSFNARYSNDDAETDFGVAVAGIRLALERRNTPMWRKTVSMIAHSDSVHAIGFQTMRYLADGLCLRLKYVRGNVNLLDGGDGVYASLLADPAPKRSLIIIDTFRYAAHGPILAEAAIKRGVEVIVFCDELCEWAAQLTPHLHVFPSEARFFIDMPSGIHFALNLLVQDVSKTRGDQVSAQMDILSSAQDRFGQYIK
jgi:DNA-binding MurR/RpiR family transcriptional regulator